MKEIGLCLDCEIEIDPNIMYCEICYKNLCNERVIQVKAYLKNGLTFKESCKIVADFHEIDIEEIELLFE
jgi:hypothetical protein